MKLFIVTPSYINTEERYELAKNSFDSLQKIIGTKYQHYVVDDIPRRKGILRSFPNKKFLSKAIDIYNKPNIKLIRRFGSGSASATVQAVQEARKDGAELIFLHLDDNVYLPILDKLIRYSIHAFENDDDLMRVGLTGYPIMYSKNPLEIGNRTLLKITPEQISFETITLKPTRFKDYTLWSSYFHENMVDEFYYPIPLWTTIYRASFLEELLTFDTLSKAGTLADVEVFYKNKVTWKKALTHFKGKLGYINMQFTGTEMQREKNWQDIFKMANEPIY